jgi:hypothetical protein
MWIRWMDPDSEPIRNTGLIHGCTSLQENRIGHVFQPVCSVMMDGRAKLFLISLFQIRRIRIRWSRILWIRNLSVP